MEHEKLESRVRLLGALAENISKIDGGYSFEVKGRSCKITLRPKAWVEDGALSCKAEASLYIGAALWYGKTFYAGQTGALLDLFKKLRGGQFDQHENDRLSANLFMASLEGK